MRINIGSIGVVRDDTQQGITSPDYVVFYCGPDLLPEYVYHYLRSEAGRHEINLKTKGSVRFRLYFEQLSKIKIPVPKDIETQQRFVNACNRLEDLKKMLNAAASSATDCLNAATRSGFLLESGKPSNTSMEARRHERRDHAIRAPNRKGRLRGPRDVGREAARVAERRPSALGHR